MSYRFNLSIQLISSINSFVYKRVSIHGWIGLYVASCGNRSEKYDVLVNNSFKFHARIRLYVVSTQFKPLTKIH